MVIATDIFDMDKIIALKDDYEGMCAYIWTLVPERYKHLDVIFHNTRYYINMCVLTKTDIPLEKKLQISRYLTKSIRVVGYTETYITCRELESRISMDRVDKYYKGDIK